MSTNGGCDCAILFYSHPPKDHCLYDVAVEIDQVSGAHGYSHVAAECCEGKKPQSIQADGDHKTVHSGEIPPGRDYARVALSKLNLDDLGVTCETFCSAAQAMVECNTRYSPKRGFPYLSKKARDKLKRYPDEGVVCSDVITQGLGERVTTLMFDWIQEKFPNNPAVAFKDDRGILITPNGIAFALGLSRGDHLPEGRTDVTPNPPFWPRPAD
jgi:hypothetical protein